jgi:hypothetical protein
MNSDEKENANEEKDQPEADTEASGTTLSDVAKSAEYADKADAGHTVEQRTEGGEPSAPEDHDRNV